MSTRKDRIGALLILGFCAVYASQIMEIPQFASAADGIDARSLPSFLCAVGAVLALLLLINPGVAASVDWRSLDWRRGALFLALLSAYGFALGAAGFLLSTTAFLATGFHLLGLARPVRGMVIAVLASAASWLLLTGGLDIHLPAWPGVHA